jgi:hypothetical protein
MAFSKSKSGKKSIPAYTVSTHHDFPAQYYGQICRNTQKVAQDTLKRLTKAAHNPVMLPVYVES